MSGRMKEKRQQHSREKNHQPWYWNLKHDSRSSLGKFIKRRTWLFFFLLDILLFFHFCVLFSFFIWPFFFFLLLLLLSASRVSLGSYSHPLFWAAFHIWYELVLIGVSVASLDVDATVATLSLFPRSPPCLSLFPFLRFVPPLSAGRSIQQRTTGSISPIKAQSRATHDTHTLGSWRGCRTAAGRAH